MPPADRSTEPARGPKTICIPCSQETYEQIVDDPVRFREFLDRQIEAAPELFPPGIRRGYRMKDLYTWFFRFKVRGPCIMMVLTSKGLLGERNPIDLIDSNSRGRLWPASP